MAEALVFLVDPSPVAGEADLHWWMGDLVEEHHGDDAVVVEPGGECEGLFGQVLDGAVLVVAARWALTNSLMVPSTPEREP